MKSTLLSLTVLVTLVLSGCSTGPQLSTMQRRAMQTRTFESSYDNVFKAVKAVLQDDGYVIENQDHKGGLILATISKTDSSSGFWAAMAGTDNYRTGEGFKVSVNLEEISKKNIETRVTIQKIEHYSKGGQQGKEILDVKMYKALYDKISIEIKRREAKQ